MRNVLLLCLMGFGCYLKRGSTCIYIRQQGWSDSGRGIPGEVALLVPVWSGEDAVGAGPWHARYALAPTAAAS